MRFVCVCLVSQSVRERERERDCKFKRPDGTACICNIILDEPPCLIDDLGLQMYTASSSSLAQCSGVGIVRWWPTGVLVLCGHY